MALYFDGAEHDAHAYDGQALDVVEWQGNEVWSGAPEGALIWNYKVISEELTNFTWSSAGRGTVLNDSYIDFKIQSGWYTESYKNRLVDSIYFDDYIVPSNVSKLLIDVDFGYIPGDYELGDNKIYVRTGAGTSGAKIFYTLSTPNSYSLKIPTADLYNSNLNRLEFYLALHTGPSADIPVSPFYVTVKIKNMYFE